MNQIHSTIRIKGDELLKAIPRQMFHGLEDQVRANHQGRTLEELEAMDGFCGFFPEDALAILERRPYEQMAVSEATRRLLQLVANFQSKSPSIQNQAAEALVSVEAIRSHRPARAIVYELNRIENKLNLIQDQVK